MIFASETQFHVIGALSVFVRNFKLREGSFPALLSTGVIYIYCLPLVPRGGAELPARGARARDQHQAGGAAAAAARAARHPRQVPHLPAVITATQPQHHAVLFRSVFHIDINFLFYIDFR